MRVRSLVLVLAAAAAFACGCSTIGSSGASLPSAGQMADARYHDPWPDNGYTMPLQPGGLIGRRR